MPKKKARFDIQGDQMIVNSDVMLEIMDCTPTMLTQYKKDGVMVQPLYGVYDLIPSIRNYLKKLKNKASAVTTEGRVRLPRRKGSFD